MWNSVKTNDAIDVHNYIKFGKLLSYIKNKYVDCCQWLNSDPDVAQRRMESMDNARRRLQEQYDAQAAKYAEEQKKVRFS